MGMLQKVRGLSVLDKVKSSDNRESLNIEPLLFRIEESQLCCYGHLTQMFHEQITKRLTDGLPRGKKPRGQPRTRWQNYVEDLA